MFSKNAIIWILEEETPAGMMTLSVNVDPNNRVMAGHYPKGDFHRVRWLLEAMDVEDVAIEDTGTYEWMPEERKAAADAFFSSNVKCYV